MTAKRSPRLEDLRLTTGRGRYVGDHLQPGTAHAAFLRADRASARIVSLDVSPARDMDDVLAVFTAEDLARAGIGDMEHADLPREDGGTPGQYPEPILCRDAIRHIGEPVALVVAETPAAALDAAEAILLELAEDTPVSGRAFYRAFGAQEATQAALAAAAHRVTVRVDIPRVTAFALEPRGAIATPLPDGVLQYRASTQSPFALRDQLAAQLGLSRDSLHCVAADVGGSFGLKGYMTREDAALVFAARALSREIAWLPGRSETMLADAQGRGVSGEVTIGLGADLSILGLSTSLTVDAGAYPSRRAFGMMNNINGITGCYRMGAVWAEVEGVRSPRAPIVPFRGNGRPEATQVIEGALDAVARAIGADPLDLRRRNMIGPEAMPVTTALGVTIDCGDFPRVMETALALNQGSEARRQAAEARGMLYGVGLANCIESAAGPLRKPRPDHARLTVYQDGRIALAPGVMSVGQGHETALSRMAADRLQVDLARIAYRNGDTRAVSSGRGSGGSAGIGVAGVAVWCALDALIAEGRDRAAAAIGCDAGDLTFRDGGFHRDGSNETLTLADLAAAAGGAWQVEQVFAPPAATFPNGTHICEVEIDPETGQTRIARYVGVEDVGTVLNPVLVAGQLHGGIGQGLSIGLGERMAHDDAGQVQTGTLMDYRMLRADDVPMFSLETVEVPTAVNPLGVKGVGEAGTVGAVAAMASAVGDALARAGVAEFQLPASPGRVWAALAAARAGRDG